MRHTPHYLLTDVAEVKRLIQEHPWATFISPTSQGVVVSHYPVLLGEDTSLGDPPHDEIHLLSHVGRPDDRLHELGEHEMTVVVQGPHGYISPSWYRNGSFTPTWNHASAHLYGHPEILSEEENFEVLSDLVDHFEHYVDEPASLDMAPEAARGASRGTLGLRIRVTHFDARLKLSQNKSPEVRANIIARLNEPGPYHQPELAEEMARVEALPRDAEGAE